MDNRKRIEVKPSNMESNAQKMEALSAQMKYHKNVLESNIPGHKKDLFKLKKNDVNELRSTCSVTSIVSLSFHNEVITSWWVSFRANPAKLVH